MMATEAARPGSVAIIHDPLGVGALAPGAPLPLMLTALRAGGAGGAGSGAAAKLELQVKRADIDALNNSLLRQLQAAGRLGLWHLSQLFVRSRRRPARLAMALEHCHAHCRRCLLLFCALSHLLAS